MILALYGATCVGKSNVARILAEVLSYETRHCGELVKDRARALGISPTELAPEEHFKIDELTRHRLLETGIRDLIIEGTLLDIVLRDFPTVYLVELVCSDDERLRRFSTRGSGDVAAFRRRNDEDLSLRSSLYINADRRAPDYVIDTTSKSIDDVVNTIASYVSSNAAARQ
jgi:cytidylate kinase